MKTRVNARTIQRPSPSVAGSKMMIAIVITTMMIASTFIHSFRVHAFQPSSSSSSPSSSRRPIASSRRQIPSPLHATATTDNDDGDENKDENSKNAQALLDQAEALRREIAAMEGKTLDEVKDEAKAKRDSERARLEAANAARNAEDEKRKRQMASTNRSGRYLEVPSTFDEMTRQASRAVRDAFKDGITRQTVRFSLISEDQSPTDENEFPGGARQMYREAGGPLTNSLLQELVRTMLAGGGTIKQQDLWDFDGSALHTVEATTDGPRGDIQAVVFPNTDVKYLNDIDEISKSMGPSRLVLLVNPFWKDVDSWSFNLLAPGAKRRARDVIFGGFGGAGDDEYEPSPKGNKAPVHAEGKKVPEEADKTVPSRRRTGTPVNKPEAGTSAMTEEMSKSNERTVSLSPSTSSSSMAFEETYCLQVFQCRGELCVSLKVYPYDEYQIFAFREQDDGLGRNYPDYSIRLGSTKTEPTSALVTELLNSRPEFKDTKTMRQMRRNIRG